MGKRLSSWERSQRDSERRARAASRRNETASRRAIEKKGREAKKSTENALKVAKTEKEIDANRLRVSKYDDYISILETLHTKYDIGKFENAFVNRLRKKTYTSSKTNLVPEFKVKPFKSVAFKKNRFRD